MALNHKEQNAILEKIEIRLMTDAVLLSKPILCSALDEDILPDDEYEQIQDYDFRQELHTDNRRIQRVPLQILHALAVLFVRNFYERGRGDDPWKCSTGFSDGDMNIRDSFKTLIQTRMRWAFEMEGNDIRSSWLRYHCWMLKAESRGDTGFRIKNNARLVKQLYDAEQGYNIFRCSWENLLEQTPDDLIDYNRPAGAYFDNKKVPAYLSALWETAGEELLYSIKALMSTDAEKPRHFYYAKWLEKIWGLGLQGDLSGEVAEVKNNQRFKDIRHPRAEWSLTRHASYRIVLTLWTSGATAVTARQGEREFTLPPTGQPVADISAEHLRKSGIRLEEALSVIFTYADGRAISLDVSPLTEILTFYNVRRLGSRMSMPRNGSRSSHAAVCVLFTTNEEPKVTFAERPCPAHPVYEGENRPCGDTYQGKEYRCRVYRLCDETSGIRKGTLSINSEQTADVSFHPVLQVSPLHEQEDRTLEGEDAESKKWDIILGHSARLEWSGSSITRISPASGSSEGAVHMKKLSEHTWQISVEDTLLDTPVSVICQSGTAERRKTLFFISPEAWKERSIRCGIATERDFAARYRDVYRYTTQDGKNLMLSFPLQETKMYWKEGNTLSHATKVRDINDLQNPALQLEVWPPLGGEYREEITCKGESREYNAAQSLCSFIEREFDPTLGDEVTVNVNGLTIATGAWKPRKAFFWDSDYLYAHPSTRSRRCVCVVAESEFKALAAGEKRLLEPSFGHLIDALEYDEDYLAALPAALSGEGYAVLLLVHKDEDGEESCESVAERHPETCRRFLEHIGAMGDDAPATKIRRRLRRSLTGIHRQHDFQLLNEMPIDVSEEINLPEACQELYEDFAAFRQGWSMFIGKGAVLTDSGELKESGTPLPIGGLMSLHLGKDVWEKISKLCVGTAKIAAYQDAAPKPYVFYNSSRPILDTSHLVPISKQGKLDTSPTRGKLLIFNESADFSDIRKCFSQWSARQNLRPEAHGLACLSELEERINREQKSVFRMLRTLQEQMIQGGQTTEAAYLLAAVVMALITQAKETKWEKLEKYPSAVTRPLNAILKEMDAHILQQFYTFARWALLCFSSRS